ncbi:MAG: rhomboid family intramembrane serine protease [Balneolaceae bacterium]
MVLQLLHLGLMTLTFIIIGITVAFSLAALYLYPPLLSWGILRPFRMVRQNTWHELVTAGFLHAGLGHLFLNMFVLFIFGPVLENTIGIYHFGALYLSGVLISSLPSVLWHRDDPQYATLGASGAVEAVLFGFILLFPTQSLYIMFVPIPVPAWVFGICFLAYSIFASKSEGSRINHEAHIAGAIWGVVYLLLFVPNTVDYLLTFFGVF